MDIQSEKLNLIRWLAGIEDIKLIHQLKVWQRSTEGKETTTLTEAEKSAIDQGLKSIKQGRVKSDDQVKQSTQDKYPDLFK
ncbi:MAG: hypothetical protein MI921_24875 [Cytophagales bacterium]|nr:hypothetical protein [Cytophagales bacterium]